VDATTNVRTILIYHYFPINLLNEFANDVGLFLIKVIVIIIQLKFKIVT
jgi:hypothetical protein